MTQFTAEFFDQQGLKSFSWMQFQFSNFFLYLCQHSAKVGTITLVTQLLGGKIIVGVTELYTHYQTDTSQKDNCSRTLGFIFLKQAKASNKVR